MARAPSKSMRPRPRPSTREEREAGERGNRAARRGDMTRREMEAGMKKGGKVTRRRSDAETTRNMQQRTNERMSNALRQSAAASGGVREGMAYGRYPGTAGDRMESERAAARRRERESARRNENEVGGRKAGGQMKTKKMAKGGMCRGMGAASRGGKYKSS